MASLSGRKVYVGGGLMRVNLLLCFGQNLWVGLRALDLDQAEQYRCIFKWSKVHCTGVLYWPKSEWIYKIEIVDFFSLPFDWHNYQIIHLWLKFQ
jgi:hypothetical protein